MKKKILITCLSIILVVLIGLVNFPRGLSGSQSEIDKAVDYLKSQPQTAWTIMALAAAGEESIDNYLNQVSFNGTSITDYAKYILTLTSVGKNPSDFQGKDFVEKLRDYFDDSTSQFGNPDYINDDIWVVLALGSIGKEYLPEVQEAKQFILDNQNSDGGWSFGLKGNSSSADMTASAIMALLEAGIKPENSIMVEAKNYLKSIQNSDGGFPGWTGDSSVSSDTWVISAIYKLGEDPIDWIKNGKNPIEYLKSLQDSEKGFFYETEGGTGEDSFVTARTSYAIIALSGKTYPITSFYNNHNLRIEGFNNTICNEYVNGGTALDLIIEGAKSCDFTYSFQYYEDYDSLLLTEINDEQNWKYRANNTLQMVGADNYYLGLKDEILWYGIDDLWENWLSTKIELTKTETLAKIQVRYYDSVISDWQNLEREGIKVIVGASELTTNNLGKIEIALNNLESGFYQLFVRTQIINREGYIRSAKVNLTIGEAPSEHQVGLKVEIEQVEVSPGEGQSTITFSVNPDILDFGKLKPGESSIRDLTINNGESRIYLETEVSGGGIFQENLEIDEKLWEFFSTVLQENQSKELKIKLAIPINYSEEFGLKGGELTFWVIKQ